MSMRQRLLSVAIVCVPMACGPEANTSASETSETSSGEGTAAATPTTSGADSSGGSESSESGGPAEGCSLPDPDTRAGFTLDLGDVPGAADFKLDLALDCETTSVELSQERITTGLSCLDAMGGAHAVVFAVASSLVGGPAWTSMEAVTLQVRGVQDFGGLLEGEPGMLASVEVAMHRSGNGELLASATRSYSLSTDLYAPLQIAADRDACGTDLARDDPNWPGPDRDMGLRFTFGEATSTLFSGQRELLTSDGSLLAIDVEQATAKECCEATLWVVAVARLVAPI